MLDLRNCDNMDLMKEFPDKYFDLAIVDPPYGIAVTNMNMGGRKTIKPDKTKNWDNAIPSPEYFNELFRVSKNQIIWGGNYFGLPPSQYFAIWDKGETIYGRDFAEMEYAWIRSGGTRIFKKSPVQIDRIHHTQKPVLLYKWILINYAKGGDKILDTHGGSFSLAIACNDLGFYLTACEIDTKMFKDAMKRVNTYIANNLTLSFETKKEEPKQITLF
jgi:site-specific DNA-methyltransferase (adenine-specific)